jgi:aminocarboxymuconate-semialdehyde decarboxylase
VHGHGVPAAFLDAVGTPGRHGVDINLDRKSGAYVLAFPNHQPLRPLSGRMLDFDERLAWLDGQGMQRQVIAPWLDIDGQGLDDAFGRDWVRQLNDYMADAVTGSQGRLSVHATLHLADAAGAAKELERCRRELGMGGAMIPTHFPNGQLTDSAYDVLWEAAEGLGMPVVLHPPTNGPASRTPEIAQLGPGLYGRLIDTTTIATQLLLAGVFDRYPRLQMVLVHGGGFLPYQSGRLDQEQAQRPHGWGLGGILSDYAKRYYFDTVLMSAPAIRLLVDFAGKEHVVVGSDYPFISGAPALTSALHESLLDQATITAVDHGNALRLYGSSTIRSIRTMR